jgi:hypothetical protein
VWLAGSGFASPRTGLVQTALIASDRRPPRLAVRGIPGRPAPSRFGQWLLGFPLMGDVALLVALYTVAAHQSRAGPCSPPGCSEAGAVMAAVKVGAGRDPPRSLLFLTATVVAALFAGLTAASGSRYLAWMDERARRLEIERDQQADDRGGRRADPDRPGTARHRVAQPVGRDHPGRRRGDRQPGRSRPGAPRR